jgi:hypothetical protein
VYLKQLLGQYIWKDGLYFYFSDLNVMNMEGLRVLELFSGRDVNLIFSYFDVYAVISKLIDQLPVV